MGRFVAGVALAAALSAGFPAGPAVAGPPEALFGRAVAGVGDVNGDGVPDLAIGDPGARPKGVRGAGRVTVHSGKDASVLITIPGGAFQESAGASVAGPGDLDGDGRPEVIVGAPGAGRAAGGIGEGAVRAHSGKDGALLWRTFGTNREEEFGRTVAVVGDLNGDQVADVLVGAPGARVGSRTCAGIARTLSGKDGKVLYQMEGKTAAERFGACVGAAGDLNGDGTPDVAAGGVRRQEGGPGSEFRVHSGRDGALLLAIPASDGDAEVTTIVALGDADGDGQGDFALGSPFDLGIDPPALAAGVLTFRSGVSGKEIRRLYGKTDFDTLGLALAPAGDADGDGVRDIWVSSRGGASPVASRTKTDPLPSRIDLVSGKSGKTLRTIKGESKGEVIGAVLAAPGDVNGDGFPDLLSGEPEARVVCVYSGKDGSVLLTLRPPPEK